MSNAVRYLHRLEQIAGELRDEADSMEKFAAQLDDDVADGKCADELQAQYHEFMTHSATHDVIMRLNELTDSMRSDEGLQPDVMLEEDLINANQHAMRLCTAMLTVSKVLSRSTR